MTCPVCSTVLYAPTHSCPACGAPLAPAEGTASAPMSVREIGAAAAALLGVTAVSEIVLTMLRILGESAAPGTVFNLIAVLVTIPVFLVWFFRARHNAGLWGPQRRSRGWAIGAWFTPGVNLWFPYQIAADAATPEQVGPIESRTLLGLVRVWWACWILALVTGVRSYHGTRVAPDGTVTHQVWIGATLGGTIASSALAALCALVGMRMVRRLSAVQDARMAQSSIYLVPLHVVQPAQESGREPAQAPVEEPGQGE